MKEVYSPQKTVLLALILWIPVQALSYEYKTAYMGAVPVPQTTTYSGLSSAITSTPPERLFKTYLLSQPVDDNCYVLQPSSLSNQHTPSESPCSPTLTSHLDYNPSDNWLIDSLTMNGRQADHITIQTVLTVPAHLELNLPSELKNDITQAENAQEFFNRVGDTVLWLTRSLDNQNLPQLPGEENGFDTLRQTAIAIPEFYNPDSVLFRFEKVYQKEEGNIFLLTAFKRGSYEKGKKVTLISKLSPEKFRQAFIELREGHEPDNFFQICADLPTGCTAPFASSFFSQISW